MLNGTARSFMLGKSKLCKSFLTPNAGVRRRVNTAQFELLLKGLKLLRTKQHVRDTLLAKS